MSYNTSNWIDLVDDYHDLRMQSFIISKTKLTKKELKYSFNC
jgi:hypothetical protein